MNEKKTLRQRYDEAEFKFRAGEKSLIQLLYEFDQKTGIEGLGTKAHKEGRKRRKKKK